MVGTYCAHVELRKTKEGLGGRRKGVVRSWRGFGGGLMFGSVGGGTCVA